MNGQGKIRGMVNIAKRPAEAADRAVPGHWEGDIMFGARYSASATLVERRSRFVLLVALPRGHGAESVAGALADAVTTLPGQLRRSLTWDQGKEMAEHARFTMATQVFLRPVFTLVARQQREHERAVGPVFPPPHRLHDDYTE
jgi:IS30 family transposase